MVRRRSPSSRDQPHQLGGGWPAGCPAGWSGCWTATATPTPAIQCRALQQFFRWWAEAEELPDPMARLRPPKVTAKLVPVFTSGELAKLEWACQGRTFAPRRDHAIICVFRATGIQLSELAGIRYDPDSQLRSDIDLWQREITVRGKGGQDRIVRICHEPPAASTGTSGSARGTPRHSGRNSGWG